MSGDIASNQQCSALVADTVDKVYNKMENLFKKVYTDISLLSKHACHSYIFCISRFVFLQSM